MKLRKISLAYIIHFLVAISFSISIDSADLDSHILEYGALYELKISELPLRVKILREVNRMQNSEKIAVFKASSAFFSIDERSRFMLDRGEIVPLEYSYKRRALGKTDKDTFAFTQNNNSDESASMQDRNEENIFDKLSVQYQLQLDLIQEQEVKIGKSFSYLVKEKENSKSYKFVVDSIEKIDTALGDLRTLRMIRERKKENR